MTVANEKLRRHVHILPQRLCKRLIACLFYEAINEKSCTHTITIFVAIILYVPYCKLFLFLSSAPLGSLCCTDKTVDKIDHNLSRTDLESALWCFLPIKKEMPIVHPSSSQRTTIGFVSYDGRDASSRWMWVTFWSRHGHGQLVCRWLRRSSSRYRWTRKWCCQFFWQLEYGEETWLAILEHVGYRNTVFRTHHIYPDDLMAKLAEAAVTLVADGSTTQDFLRFFGRCFVRYFSHYGYEKFIKVSFFS